MNKILKFAAFFILSLLFIQDISAQKPAETEDEYEKTYQRRIRQERLFGVYIPKDLTETFIELNRKIDKTNQAKLKAMPEEEAEKKLFFSLGRWIIHNWGFYGGSRLSEYMKTQFNVHHPDDMAAFIIMAYHRNLNRKSLDIKELVEHFEAKKAKELEERKSKQTILFEEKRVRPKE